MNITKTVGETARKTMRTTYPLMIGAMSFAIGLSGQVQGITPSFIWTSEGPWFSYFSLITLTLTGVFSVSTGVYLGYAITNKEKEGI